MSVNPSVTISAVRAPLPSSNAFVATVIPCENDVTSAALDAGALERGRDRREHALGLILRRRRRLCRDEPIPEREDRVRERSPDVDAEQHAGQPTRPSGSESARPCRRRNKAPRKRGPINRAGQAASAAVTSSSVSARCWCEGQ